MAPLLPLQSAVCISARTWDSCQRVNSGLYSLRLARMTACRAALCFARPLRSLQGRICSAGSQVPHRLHKTPTAYRDASPKCVILTCCVLKAPFTYC